MSSTTTTERPVVPPVLYLPCRPMTPGSQPEIELRQLEDGRLALLCYGALDRLARCCGPRQAWVLYQTADLILAILSRVSTEASDLAACHRGAEQTLRQTASSYEATEESVAAQFTRLASSVPEGWTQ